MARQEDAIELRSEPGSWRDGFISRADVAEFLVRQISDDRSIGKDSGGDRMTSANPRQNATDLVLSLRPAVALISGALCHAFFVLGVGTMIVAMFFGMSRSLGNLEAPWWWVANALLLAQFPLLHSFLLSNRGRVLLSRIVPCGMGPALSSTTFATIARCRSGRFLHFGRRAAKFGGRPLEGHLLF